jgi:A/G-specific adenine glycosylase
MRGLHEKLLDWYDRFARDLPWRRTTDPYAVWVSEIMLQQTRVDTVIPYYERFLERFPTAQALAEAEEDTVLSHWSGLGYYRRARLLHAGVREVVARYGGQVPEDADARRSLPGVGRYTAGAIGSIAFGRSEPIVDGNVTRVLARLRRIDLRVGTTKMNKRLWEEAEALVPRDRPGDFNQALMELGATICTPKQPNCTVCPLVDDCEAYARGEVEGLPVPRVRKAPAEVRLSAVIATKGRGKGRRVWLAKQDRALFGGLWGLPMVAGTPSEALREVRVKARVHKTPVAEVDHVLTHRKMRICVYRATGANATPTPTLRPFDPRELATVGLSTLTKKILAGGLAAPRAHLRA